jgi:thiamine transport system ATP-binding protein
MRAGRIEQVGPPEEVWRHPATEFVARFLGYNVTGVFGSGPAAVRPGGIRLLSSDQLSSDQLSSRPAPGGPVAGVVTGRTFRRDHFLVRVKVADGDPLEVAVFGDDVASVGDAVQLAVDPDALIPLPE